MGWVELGGEKGAESGRTRGISGERMFIDILTFSMWNLTDELLSTMTIRNWLQRIVFGNNKTCFSAACNRKVYNFLYPRIDLYELFIIPH